MCGWLLGSTVAYAVSVLAGSGHLLRGLWPELRSGRLGISSLMLLASLGAVALGHWGEGALLMSLFWAAGKLEERALERTRRTVRSLLALRPVTARVDGQQVAISDLRPGDRIQVLPGEMIPVDGTIVQGCSNVDQASLSGESLPLYRKPGDAVLATSTNCEAPLTIELTERPGSFLVDRLVSLVTEAQSQKTGAQTFLERYGGVYAWGVLLTAAAWILLGRFGLGLSWGESAYRGLILMVVASPCALVLAQPAALLSGLARGARRGILIKGGQHFARVAQARALALDKTGTLTTGEFRVLGGVGPVPQDEWLRIAARLSGQSLHPLSRAIWREAEQRGLVEPETRPSRTVWGRGVEATLEGQLWRLGRADYVAEVAEVPAELLEKARLCSERGESVVFLGGGRAAGFLRLADQIRPEAAQSLTALRDLGLEHQLILSGDNQTVVARVANQLGIEEFHGELLPQQKAARLEGMSNGCLMVGDGANDSPALAKACVGVSLGRQAAGAAVETADIMVLSADLRTLAFLRRLSQAVTRVTAFNLVFASLVMIVLAAGVALGHISLAHGVLAHEGSSLLVVLNGLRLLAFR